MDLLTRVANRLDAETETALETHGRFDTRLLARAAIVEVLSALEEPSEAMRLAAMSAYCDKVSAVAAYKQGDSDFSKGLKSGLGMVSSAELDAAYQAMLAQLRKEVAE